MALRWVEHCGESRTMSATTDGMHDLDLITFLQNGDGVLAARHDIDVQLDGQATADQPQILQQVSHGLAGVKRIGLAIQLNIHVDRCGCEEWPAF